MTTTPSDLTYKSKDGWTHHSRKVFRDSSGSVKATLLKWHELNETNDFQVWAFEIIDQGDGTCALSLYRRWASDLPAKERPPGVVPVRLATKRPQCPPFARAGLWVMQREADDVRARVEREVGGNVRGALEYRYTVANVDPDLCEVTVYGKQPR